jgi:branched-chain amino acid transport system ATP-binding protein
MGDLVLEAKGLSAGYNGVPAVRGVDLVLERGEVLAVLGPNGAGKSTTLAALVGILPLMAGSVSVLGDDRVGRHPHKLARRGLVMIPDDRGIFHGLTVRQHFVLARSQSGSERERTVFDAFPVLKDVPDRKAGMLSGGEQQMLAIAVALLMRPKILLIDEMSLGLAPKIVQDMLPILRGLALSEGIAMVLVEQHVDLALANADKAIVLNHGEVLVAGSARELSNDRAKLEAAYFGSPSTAGDR